MTEPLGDRLDRLESEIRALTDELRRHLATCPGAVSQGPAPHADYDRDEQ